jgi:nucleotide-binding universal stress UspA family protein
VLNTIVVALDSSNSSEQLILALNTLQIQAATKIILCHVLTSGETEGDLVVDRPHESQESIYQNMEKLLQNYQDTLIGQTQIEIVTGDPTEEIIRLANIHTTDLIVIGTRGLKGVNRIIEGSVSSQVVADAPCSVLVVKL